MTNSISGGILRLQERFIEQLPLRMREIRKLFHALQSTPENQELADALHRLLHSLNGSAGTFGQTAISTSANILEQQLSIFVASKSTHDSEQWQTLENNMAILEERINNPIPGNTATLKKPRNSTYNKSDALIYIVEDDAILAETLKNVLHTEGYKVEIFLTPATLRQHHSNTQIKPSAVLMDLVFSENEDSGIELIHELGFGKEMGIPVIVISKRDDIQARLAAFRAGACHYLSKPINHQRMLEYLDSVSGRQPDRPYRVFIVDDDPLQLEAHSDILRCAGMDVFATSKPLEVLNDLHSYMPDVLVLDVYMPDASGPELAAVIREYEEFLHLPILFLSSESDISRQLLALNLGGDDFLVKPVIAEHLIAAISARAKRSRQNKSIQHTLETSIYEREQEHLALNQHAIVSISDASGNITYVNDLFCQTSGYEREQLIGKNHRVVKSSVHEPEFYQDLWNTISSGKVWQGEICNRKKDGSHYWVASTITPFVDEAGLPYQYVSIRTDITHVKKAEAELEENKERLRRGQVFANIGTWDWNIQSGELYWSERIAPLFGYDYGELDTSYENFMNAIHPDDRELVSSAVTNCVENDTPYDIEHRVIWPDGTVRWLQERGATVRDEAGNPLQMLGVVQDIDNRKTTEIALLERERQLRAAQTIAHIGNWRANIISGELQWSDEIYSIFGYEPGSIEPSVEVFHNAVHPDDLEIVQTSEKQAQETGRHDVIHRIVWPNGTIRYVHELAQADTDAEGNLLTLSGTVQDITERVEAENRLRESEERFSFAVEGAGDGIWDWNVQTGEMPLSAQYEAMLGYEKGELTPSIDAWIASVHPDDLECAQDNLEKYLDEKIQNYSVEIRLRCKDGTYKWVLCRGTLVERDADLNPLRMIGIHSDISQQKLAEQALIVAKQEAERANKAKSEFLSSMSHELRTPMNAILGFTQLLEYDDDLSDENKESINEIHKAGDHLLELINEVLDLAKVESGQIELSLEPVEIGPVVEECISLVSPLAEKRNIKIQHRGLTGASIRADRTRLKQVLINLLSNAIKYNRNSGYVSLRIEPKSDQLLRILIQDTGFGIAEKDISELFQPFNRLSAENSDIEGTGIGLTLTKRIVEMMGGSVDVESELGVGSTFWIDLPIENLPDFDSIEETLKLSNNSTLEEIPESTYTLLYIEDNPANIKLVSTIIARRKEFHLLTAHTPALGIELAQARKPDLIILDINMPGMDGYQVLSILKADIGLSEIPIIALTANAMPKDIERGLNAGFNEYLTKPLNVNQFFRSIEILLKL